MRITRDPSVERQSVVVEPESEPPVLPSVVAPDVLVLGSSVVVPGSVVVPLSADVSLPSGTHSRSPPGGPWSASRGSATLKPSS